MSLAFILHRRPFKNSSLLLECFSRDRGRIPLIAKGGATKKDNGDLQPFIPLSFQWRGRGEIKTLIHYEEKDKRIQLSGNALYSGFYINELLMYLLPREHSYEELFQTYWKSLVSLAFDEAIDWQLRLFELKLLNALGYAVDLELTTEGKPIEADKNYRYIQGRGFVESQSQQQIICGKSLFALKQEQYSNNLQRRQAKRLLRGILDYYLGSKTIKSRELFQ